LTLKHPPCRIAVAHRVTKQFYGTVFVNFVTPLGAAVAVGCHGMVLAGRPVRIEYSPYKKKEPAYGS